MKYPFLSYSWEVTSDRIAVKQMDKSAFLHHGTGIHKEIASFFDLAEAELKESKSVSLRLGRTVALIKVMRSARYRASNHSDRQPSFSSGD